MKNDTPQSPIEADDCLFSQDHMDEAALDILEPEDRERFERHLAGCRICRSQLSGLDAVLLHLPFACDDIAPRADLKTSMQQRFAAAVIAEDASMPMAPAPQRSRAARRRLPGYLSSWTYGSVISGLCIALAVIALWNVLPFEGTPSVGTRGNVQVYAMQTTCEDCESDTGGHIGADPEAKDGTFMGWNLDPNEKHEVWCVDHQGQKTMIGELEVGETGSVVQTLSFPEAVGAYQEIYISRMDGTQELRVTPTKHDATEPPVPAESSPVAD